MLCLIGLDKYACEPSVMIASLFLREAQQTVQTAIQRCEYMSLKQLNTVMFLLTGKVAAAGLTTF